MGTPTVQDFHLTARPWNPLNFPKDRYLTNLDKAVHAVAKWQDPTSGAIIDPNYKREYQYGTPFFIFAAATLVDTGKAPDLLDAAIKAMDHTSGQIAACATNGSTGIIPDDHGNFFLAPLSGAYLLLKSKVPAAKAEQWRQNLGTPVDKVVRSITNNWRTYAMKGEFLRGQAGIIDMATANAYLESSWPSQLARVTTADLQWYHDQQAIPETYAYESVARMNIETILEGGYNGPSKSTMTTFTVKGGENAVKVLDPTGQGGAGGRSGDHSWNDVVPGNVYERLANRYLAQGDLERAGRYRRAAMLVLRGIDRWQRPDGAYSVTKNQFAFGDKVHFASYSAPSMYNGNMTYHQAESYYEHKADIAEWPTWNEIGGYAFKSDDPFAGAYVNAGGMHIQIALRGQVDFNGAFGIYWTALGVSRFSRVDWDSRLGPSDGIRDEKTKIGLSFAPTFMQGAEWVRLASIPEVYSADFSTTFVHPLLVRFALDYHPVTGQTGPTFHEDFVVTPDGVLTTLTSSAPAGQWGMSWPLLVNDGAGALATSVANNLASTHFAMGTDEQNFIAVGGAATLTMDGTVRSGYGDLQSIRYLATGTAANRTFVYPRSAGAPDGAAVRDSFMATANGFKTVLGRVEGNTYVGSTSAGGEAKELDLDGNGTPDVAFDQSCKFVLQLDHGRVTAVEADKAVNVTVGTNAPIALKAFNPVRIP